MYYKFNPREKERGGEGMEKYWGEVDSRREWKRERGGERGWNKTRGGERRREKEEQGDKGRRNEAVEQRKKMER